jgi:EmrB/QacA subfamily drug resistance transporter
MSLAVRAPCDEQYIAAVPATATCAPDAGKWVLAATILGSSMAFIDGTVVNVALPVLQQDLHASVAQVQWVVEAYSLFLAALLLTGGALGDHFGRRRVYAIGVGIFGLASAWCGLAPDINQLIVARAVQGCGGALLVPGSLAIIGASFDAERRGRAIGTWSGFSAITAAIGPVLGGWLVQYISWRAVFFINVPIAALVIPILYLRVPESRDEAAGSAIDVRGAVLATLGLGSLVFGLVESSNVGLTNPVVILTVVTGLLLLIAFAVAETRSPAPMMPPVLFRSRSFTGANLLTLFLYAALACFFFYLPFNLIQLQGYTPTQAGAALLPFILLMFVLSRWSGGLVDTYGARLPLLVGPLVAALGFGLLALPGIGGSYWTTYFPGISVLGLGMAITVAPLTTTVMGSVSAQRSGVASGINNAVSRLAGLLAIAVLGILVITVFSASLERRLAQLGVPPAVTQALMSQQARLTAVQIPPEVAPAGREVIRRAVEESYLASFRVVLVICAVLAILSALLAWALVEDKRNGAARRGV